MEKLTKKERKELRKFERIQEEARAKRVKEIKKLVLWGGLVLLSLVSTLVIYFLTKPAPPKPLDTQTNKDLPPVTKDDYQVGPEKAKLTLIEYADFQCPACGKYFPIVQQVKKDFKDEVKVVFRNFPIPEVHKNAQLAAQTAYAAGKQGKFWQMHDLLLGKQDKWAEANDGQTIFTQYAQELELNQEQFTADLQSKEATDFINKQVEGAEKAGVNSTPTFFLNGSLVQNPADYNSFKQLIDQELKK